MNQSILNILLTKITCLLALVVVLSACGGGGSSGSTPSTNNTSVTFSSSSSSTSSKAPAATLSILTPSQTIKVNAEGTIDFKSTNATSCAEKSLGDVGTSGSLKINPTKGGQVTYTITCTGDGDSATQSALVMTPFPVYKTSYENKVNVDLESYILPENGPGRLDNILGDVNDEWRNTPTINGLKSTGGFSPRSIVFADFLQNGSMVAMVSTMVYKNLYPDSNKNKWPDSPGKLYFLLQDSVTKKWMDISSTLFKSDADRASVVSPGFFQVADLNNDGKPDVYIAGWGPDYPLANNDWSLLQSDSYVVLSQPDGSYKTIVLPIDKFFAHQSSLADVNGDGNIDIITVNNDFSSLKHYLQKPMVLWGNGDGTFSAPDENVFPSDTVDKEIFGLTVLPIDGQLNVVLSGGIPNSSLNQWEPTNYGTKVLQFLDGKFQVVQDLTDSTPKVPGSEFNFKFVINAGFYNNQWVFLFDSPGVAKDASGNSINSALYKMDRNGKNVTAISKTFFGYSAELTITKSGYVKAMSGSCSLTDPIYKDYCSLNVPL